MRVLVWQWGRRGAGPFYAAMLARAFNETGQATALLSLSTSAELLQREHPPPSGQTPMAALSRWRERAGVRGVGDANGKHPLCGPTLSQPSPASGRGLQTPRAIDPPSVALPVATYSGLAGLAGRMLAAPVTASRLTRWLRRERIDVALCAMPAATDIIMVAALRLARIPYAVVVHDAALHPGDRFPLQIRLQRWTMRGAAAVFALSQHVADGLPGREVLRSSLPPFDFGTALPPPRAHGGKWRLLSFGRLLPYKGLDLLADAIAQLGPRDDFELRVVGSGPASAELDRLRTLPQVAVENRWVPETELPALLGWSDALILSHREASQSGVAAAAIAAGRYIVATNVGGLPEQLGAASGTILCAATPETLADGVRKLLNGDISRPTAPGAEWPTIARQMLDDLERLARPR